MTKFPINEFGCWQSTDATGHVCDQRLCRSIIELMKTQNIKTVYDMGCGEGSYTKNIIKENFVCIAYDGNPNTSTITGGVGTTLNLAERIALTKFDCVISLEVGEHIPKQYEDIFIDNICNHASKLIILSWAVIGQNGDGHVNCQNNDYIINKLNEKNFVYNHNMSTNLRSNSNLWYFKNTLMVFLPKYNEQN